MKAEVIANGVLIRQESTHQSAALGFVSIGTELDLEAEYGGWSKIANGGWIESCYTKITDTSGSGGGGAQADWNENDETNMACILNRPSYDSEMLGNTVIWINEAPISVNDGDGDGIYVGSHMQGIADIDPLDGDYWALYTINDVSYAGRMTRTDYVDGSYSYMLETEDGQAKIYNANNPSMLELNIKTTNTESPCIVSFYFAPINTVKKAIDDGWVESVVTKECVAYLADASGETPTAAEYNALLAALRNSGIMAAE